MYFQNIGWQLETIFHRKTFNTFPEIFVTFITIHEAPNNRIFDQSSSSSRNPENNLEFQSYDPSNCFVTDKSVFLHQDAQTQTSYVVFQNSYKLNSKEEFNKKGSPAWRRFQILNQVSMSPKGFNNDVLRPELEFSQLNLVFHFYLDDLQ